MGRFSELLAAPVNADMKLKPDAKAFHDQLLKDEAKQKAISDSQRRYMKCSHGKCVPILSEHAKRMRRYHLRNRKINYVNRKRHVKKLNKIFAEIGREKRIEILEKEVRELDLKLKAAKGKLYLKENKENFKKIEENLEIQKELVLEIEKAKMEIAHIKSQFERLDKKTEELKKQTESEMKFAEHLKKANRQLEIYEGRVQQSRQRECTATVENERLRALLRDMLHDRAYFNNYWETMVKKLKDRKKFLLDMIEKSSQAFSQDADFMDNFKKLTKRRAQDREAAIADMLKMKRQIDANQIISTFLGGKGNKRLWAPLEEREIRRRNIFKKEYDERLNFYQHILNEIRTFTKDDTYVISKTQRVSTKSLKFLKLLDNNGFQLYNYLNELNSGIETTKFSLRKSTSRANVDINKRNETKAFFEKRIEELHKQLNDEIEKTIKVKNSREKYDNQIRAHFNSLFEICEMLQCDLSDVKKLLGENDKITARNLPRFLLILEKRLNEMLSYVYCEERQGKDILMDSEKMTVQSLKRPESPIVKLDDVIVTTQCPECGELEDVNRFDDKFVACLGEKEVEKAMIEKYTKPELSSRMHTLLSCNLPRSGVIASRRYAE